MELSTPVATLNRVGKTLSKRLRVLGIETVRDLLWYFPFRYEDFSRICPIASLQDGQQVSIKGQVELIANKRSPRKHMIITEAVVSDDTGRLRVVWFNQPFIGKTLQSGDTVYLSGTVKNDIFGWQMTSPAYEKAQIQNAQTEVSHTIHTARIVPVYSVTAGITQKQMRYLVKQIIPLADTIPEWLSDDIRDRADVMPLGEAIHSIHFPKDQAELHHAERRLKFDEVFLLQLRAALIRRAVQQRRAPALHFHERETRILVQSLPFTLTNDQKVAAWEILKDIQRSEPMNRLLQGDVGSGKTVVAALAAYNCVLNGYQAAMIVPTEILAKQHYESLLKIFSDTIGIALMTRSEFQISNFPSEPDHDRQRGKFQNKSQIQRKKELITLIAGGQAAIIVGTHALLQEDVHFAKLGIVVVDEQHRFGVQQRKVMKEKSVMELTPHFLSMTATPIPRSLALTLYGDLDVSLIHHKPPGRKEIQTRLVEPRHRDEAYEFIREQVKKGRQVFVICPLIEKNDELRITNDGGDERKSVAAEYEKLSQHVFLHLRVGYLHGKMSVHGGSTRHGAGGKPNKTQVMKDFAEGRLDILVSTSVVEVGVDIPNASVMMIEGADHFGLAQLHQFRGRVGRSDHQSYCFLFTDSDSQKAKERLQFFEKNTDGFGLAEFDLETRGPGEVYGTAQSGMMNLKLATMHDVELIKLARDIASGIDFVTYPEFSRKVEEWERDVHLE